MATTIHRITVRITLWEMALVPLPLQMRIPPRTAELSTEQNYNQIDGVLNNQPTVAQLEQDAKSGKPISPLMDLLDATRREEKQSVMEQLKTKPPQDSKEEKTAPSIGAEMER